MHVYQSAPIKNQRQRKFNYFQRQTGHWGLPLSYGDRDVTERFAKDQSAELSMAFFDEISGVHEQKIRYMSVHLVAGVYLDAHYF